jgi:hypothetical protein
MLKTLTQRIKSNANGFIGNNQFEFTKRRGTRNAIGVMRVLCERSPEHGNDVYIGFVDFDKAFDRLNCIKMMEVLRQLQVDWKDRRLISDLHETASCSKGGGRRVRISGDRSECATRLHVVAIAVSIYAAAMMLAAMEGQQVEQITTLKYRGAVITEKGTCVEEVKARIAMAKVAFNESKELLTRGLKKDLKKRMVKKRMACPVALYGCETWTMKQELVDKLKAFEM